MVHEPRSALRRVLAAAKRETVDAALRALPDEWSIQAQYLRAFGRFANLREPRRFTEKIQALKLRGGLEAYSGWVDKIEAKRRVASLLGNAWITPNLWTGAMLPPRAERNWPAPFVIKANHGSGWYRHVVTEADKDWPVIERHCADWLRRRWHPHLRERQYDGITPQLLVEPRLGGTAEVLPYDYKFGVFNGRVRYCGVTVERLQGAKVAIMDREWRLLPFTVDNTPASPFVPDRPAHLEEMIAAAETLAKPFLFARIDFYDLPNGPRFGEVTLTPASGLLPLAPDDWDFRLGDMLDVSSILEPRWNKGAARVAEQAS